jgi:hypothetical protein
MNFFSSFLVVFCIAPILPSLSLSFHRSLPHFQCL